MSINWPILLLAAIIPLIVGFIWYNPKVFGTVWMKASGMTEDQMKGSNMALVFGLTYFYSLLIAMFLLVVVIHQFHVYSIFAADPGVNDPTTEVGAYFKNFMDKYGNNFRTFKHGAFHGTLLGIFLTMPLLGINALFERKPFKYVLIHTGYWIVTFALMGGVICGFNK
jgi:hypothetical protein